jgi:hypothetical protein
MHLPRITTKISRLPRLIFRCERSSSATQLRFYDTELSWSPFSISHNAARQSIPDAIQPNPAPITPQKGPIMKIITKEPRAPIPHAASFGLKDAR